MKRNRRRPDTKSADSKTSGSGYVSSNSEPEFLLVGEITRPHGVRGEVLMRVFTDYPERLAAIKQLYIQTGGHQPYRPYRVKKVRQHAKGRLLQFFEVPDRDAAELLRESRVYVHINDAVPLEEGEYYLFQIEGIRVITDEGQELGHLTDWIETGANNVYVVTGAEDKQVLLPAIPEVILKVDLESKVMTVHLLDGLV